MNSKNLSERNQTKISETYQQNGLNVVFYWLGPAFGQ